MGVIEAKSLASETNGELVTDLTSDDATGVDYKTVKVKGLGNVRLRTLSAEDFVDMAMSDESTIVMICRAVVDGNGDRVHDDGDPETVANLRNIKGPIYEQLMREIRAFSMTATNLEDVLGN